MSLSCICEQHREQLGKGSRERRDHSSHRLYLVTLAKEIRKAGTLQSWRVSPGGESTRTRDLVYSTNAHDCGGLEGSEMTGSGQKHLGPSPLHLDGDAVEGTRCTERFMDISSPIHPDYIFCIMRIYSSPSHNPLTWMGRTEPLGDHVSSACSGTCHLCVLKLSSHVWLCSQ